MKDEELDILREIATIGAGNASRALGKIVGQVVDVQVPNVKLVMVEEVPDVMGAADQVTTVVQVKILGDVSGVVILFLNPKDGIALAKDISQGRPVSFLEEVVNIISGAALASLGNFLGMSFFQSIPGSASDMLRALINEIVTGLGVQVDSILVLEIPFVVGQSRIQGRLYFLFDSVSTEKILTAARGKIGREHG